MDIFRNKYVTFESTCIKDNILFTRKIYLTHPVTPTGLSLYPLKTSENLWFSDVLGDVEKVQSHDLG